MDGIGKKTGEDYNQKMIWEFFLIRKKLENRILRIFSNNYDKILDIGSGKKPHYHKSIKGRLICFDIRQMANTHIVGDASHLPFRKNSFDKIISVNSFYYFENPFEVAGDMARILKSNGKLVLVMPFFYPIHDAPYDRYRFSEYGLRTILDKDFRINRLEALGGIFTLPSVMFHGLIKGFPLVFPKPLRQTARIISYLLFPAYMLLQLLGIFDFLDRTRRVPTYYLVVASKK